MTEEEKQQELEENEEKIATQSFRDKMQPFLWLVVLAIGIFLLFWHFGAIKLWRFFLAISLLSIIIIVHEFGHFIAAKISGMRVDGFSFGFPPTVVGFRRTAGGYRIRLLPMLFRKERPEGWSEEEIDANIDIEQELQKDGLTYTFGKPKKAGETEYRLGLIPFGGYVKILGQEDIGRMRNIKDPRAYMNQPIWKRVFVISAGVICNLILAAILCILIFGIGIKLEPPVLGTVAPGYPAAKAGLKGGDEIIEVEGHSYNLKFDDVSMWVGLADKDKPVNLKVRHEDGSVEDYQIVPYLLDNPLAPIRVLGIGQAYILKIGKLKEEFDRELLYSRTGLKPGDIITAVNGIEVDKYWQFDEIISNLYEPNVTLTAEREIQGPDGIVKKQEVETDIDLTLTLFNSALDKEDKGNDLHNLYSIEPCLKVDRLMLMRDNKFQRGDILVKIGDIEYPSYADYRRVIEDEDNKGKEIIVEVLRADANGIYCRESIGVVPSWHRDLDKIVTGIWIGYDFDRPVVAKTVDIEFRKKITPALEIPSGAMITAVNGREINSFYDFAREMKRNEGNDTLIEWLGADGESGETVFSEEMWAKVGAVDTAPAVRLPFKQMQRLYKADGVFDALKMGYKEAGGFVLMGLTTIKQALRGQVNPKSFMGPVGIASYGYKIASESSILKYLFVVALISAFIGVLNAMPILPFDGGHIIFLIIEKIKGSPVSERIQVNFMMTGLILLLILAAYITFYDVLRSIVLFG